jgi:hypothetical protein
LKSVCPGGRSKPLGARVYGQTPSLGVKNLSR